MRKQLIAAIVSSTAVFSASALAADLPVKAVYKAPPPVVVFNWTGFYVGGHVGIGRTDTSYLSNHVSAGGPCTGNVAFAIACDPINAKATGIIGGGQAGIRWQMSSWVVGLEGTWTGFGRNVTTPSVSNPGALTYDTKVRDVYTATAQVGYAWDRTLWYVKGGYAGARLALDSNATGVFAPANVRANGWTVGTGVEYAILPNLSLALEYDHIRVTGSATTCATPGSIFSCPNPTPPLQYADIKSDIDQVVARLNYRFDWFGPVVARY